MDSFLGSLVQSCCGEGGMLPTDNTGMCSQCLGHTGFAPRSRHVCFPCLSRLGSRLFCRELSEAGPGLYALPRSKPLRFMYSGSPQRCRLGWVCILFPSHVRAAQVTRCLVSVVAATWFSRCTTIAPSQTDVARPGSQEVLVCNKACLQFGR